MKYNFPNKRSMFGTNIKPVFHPTPRPRDEGCLAYMARMKQEEKIFDELNKK